MLYDYLRRFSRGASRLPFKNWQTCYRHETPPRVPHSTETVENHENASSPHPSRCYFGPQGQRSADLVQPDTNGPWPPKTQSPFYPSDNKLYANPAEDHHGRVDGLGASPPDPSRCYPGTKIEAPPWIQHPRPSLPSMINIPRAPDPFPGESTVIYAGPGSSGAIIATEPVKESQKESSPVISFVDGSYKILESEKKGEHAFDGNHLTHKECEPSICRTCGSIKIGTIGASDAVYEAAPKPPQQEPTLVQAKEPLGQKVGSVQRAKSGVDPTPTGGDPKPEAEVDLEQDSTEDYIPPGQLRTGPVHKQSAQAAKPVQGKLQEKVQKAPKQPHGTTSAVEPKSKPPQGKKSLDGEFTAEQSNSLQTWKATQAEPWKVTELRADPVQQAPTTMDSGPGRGVYRAAVQTQVKLAQEATSTNHLRAESVPKAPKTFRTDDQPVWKPTQVQVEPSVGPKVQASNIVHEDHQAGAVARIKPVQPASYAMSGRKQQEHLSKKEPDVPRENTMPEVNAESTKDNVVDTLLGTLERGPQPAETTFKHTRNAKHSMQNTEEITIKTERKNKLQCSHPFPNHSDPIKNPPQNTEPVAKTSAAKKTKRSHRKSAHKQINFTPIQQTVEDSKITAANSPEDNVAVQAFMNDIRNMQENTVKNYIEMKSPFWDTSGALDISNTPGSTKTDLARVEELMAEISDMKKRVMQQNHAVTERFLQETSAIRRELQSDIAALRCRMDEASASEKPTEEIAKIKNELINEMEAVRGAAASQNLAMLVEKPVKKIEAVKDELIQKMEAIDKVRQQETQVKSMPVHTEIADLKENLIKEIGDLKKTTTMIAEKGVKEIASMKAELKKEISSTKLLGKPSEENLRLKELIKEMAAVQEKAASFIEKPVNKISALTEELIKEMSTIKIQTIKNTEMVGKPVRDIASMKNELLRELGAIKSKTVENLKLAEKPVKEVATMKEGLTKQMEAMKAKIDQNVEASQKPAKEIAIMKEDLMRAMATIKENNVQNYAKATEKPARDIAMMKEIAAIRAKIVENDESREPAKEIETMKRDLLNEIATIKANVIQNHEMPQKSSKEITTMKEDLMKEIAAMKEKPIQTYAMANEIDIPLKKIETMKQELMAAIASIGDKSTENCVRAANKPVKEMATIKNELMKEMAFIKEKVTERSEQQLAGMNIEAGRINGTEINKTEIPTAIDIMEMSTSKGQTLTTDKISKSEVRVFDTALTKNDLAKELESIKERTIQNALLAGVRMKEIAAIKEKLSQISATLTDKISPNKINDITEPNDMNAKTLQLATDTTGIHEGHDHKSGNPQSAVRTVDSGDICSLTGHCEIPYDLLRLRVNTSASKPGGDSYKPSEFSDPHPPVSPKFKKSSPNINKSSDMNQTGPKESGEDKVNIERPGFTPSKRKKLVNAQPEQTGPTSTATPPSTGTQPSQYPISKSPTHTSKRPPPCFPPTTPSYNRYSTIPPIGDISLQNSEIITSDAPSTCIRIQVPFQCSRIPTDPPRKPPPVNPSVSKTDSANQTSATPTEQQDTTSVPSPVDPPTPDQDKKEMAKEEFGKELAAMKADTIDFALATEKPVKEIESIKDELVQEMIAMKADTIDFVVASEKPAKEIGPIKDKMMQEMAAMNADTITFAVAPEKPVKEIQSIKDELMQEMVAMKADTIDFVVASEKPAKEIEKIKNELMQEMAGIQDNSIQNYTMAPDSTPESSLASKSKSTPTGPNSSNPSSQGKSTPAIPLPRLSSCCPPLPSGCAAAPCSLSPVVQCRPCPPHPCCPPDPCCPPPCPTPCSPLCPPPTCGQAPDDLIKILKRGVIPIEQSTIQDYFCKGPGAATIISECSGKDCPCPPGKSDNTRNNPPTGSSSSKPASSSDNPGRRRPPSSSGSPGNKPPTKSGSPGIGRRSPTFTRPSYSGHPRSHNLNSSGPPNRSGRANKNESSSTSTSTPKSGNPGTDVYLPTSGSSHPDPRSVVTDTNVNSTVTRAQRTLVNERFSASHERPSTRSRSSHVNAGSIGAFSNSGNISNSGLSQTSGNTPERPPSTPGNPKSHKPLPISIPSSIGRPTLSTDRSNKPRVTKALERTARTARAGHTLPTNKRLPLDVKPAEWDEKGVAKSRCNLLKMSESVQVKEKLLSTKQRESHRRNQDIALKTSNNLSGKLRPKSRDMIWRAIHPSNFPTLSKKVSMKSMKVFTLPESAPSLLERMDKSQTDSNLARTVQMDTHGKETKTITETGYTVNSAEPNSNTTGTPDKIKGSSNGRPTTTLASNSNDPPALSSGTTHPDLNASPQHGSLATTSVIPVSELPKIQAATILLLSRVAENLRVRTSKPASKDSSHKKSRSGLIATRNSTHELPHRRQTSFPSTSLVNDQTGRPKNTIDITYHEGLTRNTRELTKETSPQFQRLWPENCQQRQNDILNKLASLPAMVREAEEHKTAQHFSSSKTHFDTAKFLRDYDSGKSKNSFYAPQDYTVYDVTDSRQHSISGQYKSLNRNDKRKLRAADSLPEQTITSFQDSALRKERSEMATQVLTKQQVAEHNQKITKLEREMSAVREKHLKEQDKTEEILAPHRSWKEQWQALLPDPKVMDRAIAKVVGAEREVALRHLDKKAILTTGSLVGEDFDSVIAEILSVESHPLKSDSRQTQQNTLQTSQEISITGGEECAAAEILSIERMPTKGHEINETSVKQTSQNLQKLISHPSIAEKTGETSRSLAQISPESVPDLSDKERPKHHKPYSNQETRGTRLTDKETSKPLEYRPLNHTHLKNQPSAALERTAKKTSSTLVSLSVKLTSSKNGENQSNSQPIPPTRKKSGTSYQDFKGTHTLSFVTVPSSKPLGKSLHTSAEGNLMRLRERETSCIHSTPASESLLLRKSPDQNPQNQKKTELKSQSGPPGCPCAGNAGSTSLRGSSPGGSGGGNIPRDGGSRRRPPNDGSLPMKVKDGLNKQLAMEMGAFLGYFKMMAHFGRVDIAYRGIESFFRKQVEEEREHALEIASWTNIRGGVNQMNTISNDCSQPPQCLGSSHVKALAEAVAMEASVTKALHELRNTSENCSDVITSKYLSKLFLREQAESINEISRLVTNAQRAETSPREMLTFDENLYAKYKDDEKGIHQ